jgi:type II secretory pathway component PulK
MPRDADRDARLIIVMVLLILLVVLNAALILYFRKKENDSLETLFRMQDRINQLESKVDQSLKDSTK